MKFTTNEALNTVLAAPKITPTPVSGQSGSAPSSNTQVGPSSATPTPTAAPTSTSEPVCGNNTKEKNEECDGSDSTCAYGNCQKNCTCPSESPSSEPSGTPVAYNLPSDSPFRIPEYNINFIIDGGYFSKSAKFEKSLVQFVQSSSVCGNSSVEAGEECEGNGMCFDNVRFCINCMCLYASFNPNPNANTGVAVCGNGKKDAGEECDGSACSDGSYCGGCMCIVGYGTGVPPPISGSVIMCGNGIKEAGEKSFDTWIDCLSRFRPG